MACQALRREQGAVHRSVLASDMDRGVILDQLALALRNVVQTEMHIAQQHESIETLERLGLDASALKGALIQFEELRAMHVADRDRLKKELDENHPRGSTYLEELSLLSFWPKGEK